MPETPPYTKDYLKDLIDAGEATVGEHSYGTPSVRRWMNSANLHIGKYCSIAEEVLMMPGGNHRIEWITTYPFSHINGWDKASKIKGHPSTRGDIIIGNDVWIGFGALILSGVTIGDGAVVGARAVVAKSVPPYAIVVGNPARVIRYRFPKWAVAALLKLKWWDWSEEQVNEKTPQLMSGNLVEFLADCGFKEPSRASRILASLRIKKAGHLSP